MIIQRSFKKWVQELQEPKGYLRDDNDQGRGALDIAAAAGMHPSPT